MDADQLLAELTTTDRGGDQHAQKRARSSEQSNNAASAAESPPNATPLRPQNGRGNNRPKSDMRDMLEDIRVCTSQLLLAQRMDAKERNIILEIAPKANIREVLGAARDKWYKERPTDSKHPLGEIHLLCWNLLVASAKASVKTDDSAYTGPAKALLGNLLSDTGASVARFIPLSKGGRPSVSDKPWLWQLRVSVVTENGPSLHRELLSNGNALFIKQATTLRADTAPARKIEKRSTNFTVR